MIAKPVIRLALGQQLKHPIGNGVTGAQIVDDRLQPRHCLAYKIRIGEIATGLRSYDFALGIENHHQGVIVERAEPGAYALLRRV
jgi:hypothetical protein